MNDDTVFIDPVPCTTAEEDMDKLKDARQSFPSGHASFSAFTMVYLVVRFSLPILKDVLTTNNLSLADLPTKTSQHPEFQTVKTRFANRMSSPYILHLLVATLRLQASLV